MFSIPVSKIESVLGSDRVALMSLWHKDHSLPPQAVLVKKEVLDKTEGEHIHADVILHEAVKDDSLAVEGEFSATALNAINSLYYSSCKHAFNKKSSLATFYVKNRMAQYVIMNTILERITTPAMIIKEICCGAVYSRWQHFAKYLPSNRSIKAVLSDFSADIIPKDEINNLNIKNMTFDYESYDLRKSFELRDEKVDVMLVTYGFDSVWLEDDNMYVKRGKDWYQILYRVKVLPTAENAEELVALLRKGFSEELLELEVFDNVVVETKAEKIDIMKAPYGKYVYELYKDYEDARTCVPAALVARVKEAFETQIKADGLFMIGEVATYPIEEGKKIELTISDYNTTGKVGKYKVEDFWLADKILTDMGFDVEVLDIAKAAEKYGKTIEEDTEDTWLMIVKKK